MDRIDDRRRRRLRLNAIRIELGITAEALRKFNLERKLNVTEDEYGLWRQPKDSMPRIEAVWMVVSIDPVDNCEGVAATTMPNGVTLPLIASDEKRLENILPIARDIAMRTGMKFKLVKFTQREELGDIDA